MIHFYFSKKQYGAFLFLVSLLGLTGCKENGAVSPEAAPLPQVEENGALIRLSPLADTGLFKIVKVRLGTFRLNLDAPSRVVASLSHSKSGSEGPIALFESADLTSLYSSFNQNKANFDKMSRNVERTKDLFAHQAATGKDLGDAQNDWTTANAVLKETESKLRALGFDPGEFQKAAPGQVWMISDISETQIHSLHTGSLVSMEFTSYPGEEFQGKVEAIGEVVDALTRTVKVRISVPNSTHRLRPGMFANVRFGREEKQVICLPPSTVVTVQGHDYLFVCTRPGEFRRREIILGQQSGDSVAIVQGLKVGEVVAVEGAILLKGISFGY